MKFILSLLLAVVFLSSTSFAQETSPLPSQPDHYCDDETSWQKWEDLLSKYPNDDTISSLYAFRVGLCSMVKSGKIETKRATRLFERMRDSVLKGIEEEEQQENLMRGDEGV